MTAFEELFSINGVWLYPPSQYQEDPVPVVGYNQQGHPIRQGFQAFTFVWDLLNQERMTALMNTYTPSTPQKSVIYIAKETGELAHLTGMMHEPVVGRRSIIYYENVSIRFTQCVTDVGYNPGDPIPITDSFTLQLRHLGDVDDGLAASPGDVLTFNGVTWIAGPPSGGGGGTTELTVKRGGTVFATDIHTLDFSNNFDINESPNGEANISLQFGTSTGQVLEGNHSSATSGVHGVGAGAIVGTTLSQLLTNKTLTDPIISGFSGAQHDHLDAEGGGLLSLAAIGDITEAVQDIVGTSFVDSLSVTFSYDALNHEISAAVVLGNNAGQAAPGNHLHPGVYQPFSAILNDIAMLTDPDADRILFWDDTIGGFRFLTVGENLTITGDTLDAASGGGTGVAGQWSVLTNGDPGDPQFIFGSDGDVIMTFRETP